MTDNGTLHDALSALDAAVADAKRVLAERAAANDLAGGIAAAGALDVAEQAQRDADPKQRHLDQAGAEALAAAFQARKKGN